VGGGAVIYTYVVTNTGDVPVFNVAVTDNKCAPVTGGGDGKLDPKETATYTCTTTLTETTTNIGTAKADWKDCTKDQAPKIDTSTVQMTGGDNNGGNHEDSCVTKAVPEATDSVTVTVAVAPPPADAPAITIAKSVDHPTLLAPGGTATYSYLVTNTGNIKLWNIKITDDAGTPGVPGDDAAFSAAIVCPATSLDVGANMTCHSAAVTFGANATGSNIVTTNIASASADTGADCSECSISSDAASATVTVLSAGTEAATDVPAAPTAPPTDVIVSTTTDAGGSLPLLLIVLGIIGLGAVVLTPGRAKR
jgi:uncharacterized repeat protein (TIGR01451 family)